MYLEVLEVLKDGLSSSLKFPLLRRYACNGVPRMTRLEISDQEGVRAKLTGGKYSATT